MIIAVTYENGKVFQHFGHTEQFKLYKVENQAVVESAVVSSLGSGHSALADFLAHYKVEVLICGGIGAGAKVALANCGIKLFPGVEGDADTKVADFVQNQLVYDPNKTCNHHGHDHKNCSEHDENCTHLCGE